MQSGKVENPFVLLPGVIWLSWQSATNEFMDWRSVRKLATLAKWKWVKREYLWTWGKCTQEKNKLNKLFKNHNRFSENGVV